MKAQATATFRVTEWEERPFDEMDNGPKLTRATVTKTFQGDIEGEGSVEYLMTHLSENQASFVGLERIVGRVAGRAGTFVLQHVGTFEHGTAKATWFVVAGSGTGELRALIDPNGIRVVALDLGPRRVDADIQGKRATGPKSRSAGLLCRCQHCARRAVLRHQCDVGPAGNDHCPLWEVGLTADDRDAERKRTAAAECTGTGAG